MSSPATTTREIGDRERRLLDVAARLFAKRGYADTTMRQIANEAGIGLGAMYYHVPGKEELLARIHEEFVGAIVNDLREITASIPDARAALIAAARLMTRYLDRYQHHMDAFFSEQRRIRGRRFAQVVARRKEFEDLIDELLRRGVGQGHLRPNDISLSRLALLGMFNYGHQWYRRGGRSTPEQIADCLAGIFLDGLAPHATSDKEGI